MLLQKAIRLRSLKLVLGMVVTQNVLLLMTDGKCIADNHASAAKRKSAQFSGYLFKFIITLFREISEHYEAMYNELHVHFVE